MVLRAVRGEGRAGRGRGVRGTDEGGREVSEEKKGREGREDMRRNQVSKSDYGTGDG